MKQIEERVFKLFIAVDECDWDMVEECFDEFVETDYSSMNSKPAANVKAKELIAGWKTLLPGFTKTQHQIGNMIVKAKEHTASVFCYGTAAHYLESEENGVWRVGGSYDIDLEKVDNDWKITRIKLNYKYQEGNKKLPQLAIKEIESINEEAK